MPKTLFRYLLLSCLICSFIILYSKVVIQTTTQPNLIIDDYMEEFINFLYPEYDNTNVKSSSWEINKESKYLLHQIQQFRKQSQLDSLIVDSTLCRTATFHNQEMIDFNYRTINLVKGQYPYQGLLLYTKTLCDYLNHSFAVEASSLSNTEQEFFCNDSLRQVLLNPQVNCIGLAINKAQNGYICTVYLSERYVFFEKCIFCGGPTHRSFSYLGTSLLPYFLVKAYYYPFQPKEILRIEDIDPDALIQEIEVICKENNLFSFSIKYPIGPTQVLVYYDEQNRPVALGYLHGQIQKKYYIDEDGTKHYLD